MFNSYRAIQAAGEGGSVSQRHIRRWLPNFYQRYGHANRIKSMIKRRLDAGELHIPPGLDRVKNHVDAYFFRAYSRKAEVMYNYLESIWPAEGPRIVADLTQFLNGNVAVSEIPNLVIN